MSLMIYEASTATLGFGGDELDEALILLEPENKKKKKKKKEKAKEKSKPKQNESTETFVSKDSWRSQSKNPTDANKKYQDSEPGDSNCKYVAEKMVYRHLYGDLDPEFERKMVVDAPVGTYDYVVGSTGAHQYLSVQREDKAEVKDIIPKKHKKSSFEEASSANVAIDYLSGYVGQGVPVVVGVDHTYNRSLSSKEGSTSSKKYQGLQRRHYRSLCNNSRPRYVGWKTVFSVF